MLLVACKGIPDISRGPRKTRNHSGSARTIDSLAELRQVVDDFRDARRKGIQREEENHVIIFFTSFFSQVQYLRHLKHYFDERIYTCLYQYFYDPSDDLHEHKPYANGTTPDNRHASSASKRADSRKAKSKEKLSFAVSELFRLSQKWDQLFQEKNDYSASWEPGSANDPGHYAEARRFDYVLRLVPDLLLKAGQCLELARLWWIHANKLYSVPGQDRVDADATYREKVPCVIVLWLYVC